MAAGVRWSYLNPAEDLLKRFVAQRELPRPDQVADLRWGKPADFQDLLRAATVTVIWPADDNADDEEPPPLQYNEEARATETIRIENPEDSEQYVEVERITSIIFRGPDGRRHQFNLNPGR